MHAPDDTVCLGKLRLTLLPGVARQRALQRQTLARAANLPLETIELLVDACDLCRMTGMSGLMLRRCLAMGYQRMADFRRADPSALRREPVAHLEASGERSNHMVDIGWFVQQAQWLPDAVE